MNSKRSRFGFQHSRLNQLYDDLPPKVQSLASFDRCQWQHFPNAPPRLEFPHRQESQTLHKVHIHWLEETYCKDLFTYYYYYYYYFLFCFVFLHSNWLIQWPAWTLPFSGVSLTVKTAMHAYKNDAYTDNHILNWMVFRYVFHRKQIGFLMLSSLQCYFTYIIPNLLHKTTRIKLAVGPETCSKRKK